MAGATGARSWLQAHHFGWLAPRRMKAATIALFAVATLVASIGLSGSTAPAKGVAPAHASALHNR
jgi:hypothetical protein